MLVKTWTPRGFGIVTKDGKRVAQESSAIGDYLWIGDEHLDRDEVATLVSCLQSWLTERRLVGMLHDD